MTGCVQLGGHKLIAEGGYDRVCAVSELKGIGFLKDSLGLKHAML